METRAGSLEYFIKLQFFEPEGQTLASNVHPLFFPRRNILNDSSLDVFAFMFVGPFFFFLLFLFGIAGTVTKLQFLITACIIEHGIIVSVAVRISLIEGCVPFFEFRVSLKKKRGYARFVWAEREAGGTAARRGSRDVERKADVRGASLMRKYRSAKPVTRGHIHICRECGTLNAP